MNELKILRLILRKQGILLNRQQATIDAQAEELARYKLAVAADVESIKERLDVVEATSPAAEP